MPCKDSKISDHNISLTAGRQAMLSSSDVLLARAGGVACAEVLHTSKFYEQERQAALKHPRHNQSRWHPWSVPLVTVHLATMCSFLHHYRSLCCSSACLLPCLLQGGQIARLQPCGAVLWGAHNTCCDDVALMARCVHLLQAWCLLPWACSRA